LQQCLDPPRTNPFVDLRKTVKTHEKADTKLNVFERRSDQIYRIR
jgi:hypothetical protein